MIAVLSDELKGIKVPLTSPRAIETTPTSSTSSSSSSSSKDAAAAAAAAAAPAAAAAAPEPVKSDTTTAGLNQQQQQRQEEGFAIVTPEKAATAPASKVPPCTPYSPREADAAAATWAELQRRIKAGSGN
jgi:ATP-dependent helicase/nuclease subunit A